MPETLLGRYRSLTLTRSILPLAMMTVSWAINDKNYSQRRACRRHAYARWTRNRGEPVQSFIAYQPLVFPETKCFQCYMRIFARNGDSQLWAVQLMALVATNLAQRVLS